MKRLLAAASVGHAVWFSRDEGASWLRPHTTHGGLYNESRAWCLSAHAERPGELLAGTDQGLYRWSEAKGNWTYLPSPLDGFHVLKLAQSPHDPRFIVAGTRPAAIFVSRDEGLSWERARLPLGPECWFINTPRVTSLQFDPFEAETVWATVEIGGIFVSRDGGRSWEQRNAGLRDPDVHNLVIFDRGRGRELLATTEVGLHRTTDDGLTWDWFDVPADPNFLILNTMFGEIWMSDDGGERWRRSPRVLGELREVAWLPA